MKIIHTSDWHLGQVFFNRSRITEQKRFLDWLKIVLASLKIDAIIVAGDVFDTARPSYEAQRLLADFLAFCAHEGIHAIITAGNHDSAECLRVNAKLALETKFIHIISHEDKIIHLKGISIAAAPFLQPKSAADLENISRFSIEHFRSLAQRARELAPDDFLIGVGHLATISDAQEGEQAIYIGHSECVDKNALNMFDYFALGHIHKASGVAVRYCGSPLMMSFSQAQQKNSLSLLVINEDGNLADSRIVAQNARLHTIDVPQFCPMLKLSCKDASGVDLSALSKNAYLSIELEECDELSNQALHEQARELGLQLVAIRQKASQKSASCKELSLDDINPQMVLEEVLREKGREKTLILESALAQLEQAAANELAAKELQKKVLNED